ncbi:glycosyltransferase family 2 protein [Hymenobacter sp. B1770]|uniref:glycosyltransferase family 2 protein n=1 Tax=Hymenobacter sp. B1770 TaxID=1718788 RepID=UPI003CF4AC45
MRENPLVSIVAINYNNFKYVLNTLESIANQTYSNIEFIIVDDFSTDGSLSLIKQWIADSNIVVKLVCHERNLGVCAACNSGLYNSKGKYVSLIATDDVMMFDKIEVQVEALELSENSVCAVYSDMEVIDENGSVIYESYNALIGLNSEIISEFYSKDIPGQIAFLINKNIFPAPAMFFKKEALLSINGWDENLYFDDLDLNMRLVHSGYQYLNSESKLVKYRLLQTSMARKPNPRYWASYLILISKYRGMSKEVDLAINSKINELSPLIYQLNGKDSLHWLKENFRIRLNAKSFIYMACSFMGVRAEWLKKLKNALIMYKASGHAIIKK